MSLICSPSWLTTDYIEQASLKFVKSLTSKCWDVSNEKPFVVPLEPKELQHVLPTPNNKTHEDSTHLFALGLIRLYQKVSTSCSEGLNAICDVLKQVFLDTLPLDTTFVLCSVYIPESAGSHSIITLAARADLWLPWN